MIDRRRIPDARTIAEGEGSSLVVDDSAAWDQVLRTIAAVARRTGGAGQPREIREPASGFITRADDAGSDPRLRHLLRSELDLAIAVADRATVLRHRSLGAPLVFCENGRTTEVDAWSVALARVPLPGD